MKVLASRALALSVLALGAWALALQRSPSAPATPERAAPERARLLPYPGEEPLTLRRVVAEADGRFAPAPDGTRFTWVDHTGDLVILDLRTGESKPMPGGAAVRADRTGAPGFVFHSRMSPDGRHVAYQLNRDGHSAIRVVELEDGSVRDLVEHPDIWGLVDLGSWSPDGRWLAVALMLDDPPIVPGTIALVRVDDGTVTEVAAFENRPATTPTFSPDGRWLAYERARAVDSWDRDIFLRAVQGGRERRLTRGPGDHRIAGWLPGGGPLFYLSGDVGRYDLLAVELENGRAVSEPRLVRSDLWHVWPRGFSGNAFFFVQMPERTKSHTARIDPAAGRLTSPLRPVIPATSLEWLGPVAWSPGGERMVYMIGHDLAIRSLSTGVERRIPTTFNALGTRALAWSPVAERIAIEAADHVAGTLGVHLMDLEHGTTELIIPGGTPFFASQPRWAPDGQALFAARREPDRAGMGIVRFDLRTGQQQEVFRTERYRGFALHPDGRQLAIGQHGAVAGEADRVLVVPFDDDLVAGEPRELVRIPAPGTLSQGNACLDWSPDARYLIIGSDPDAEHRRTLWIVDTAADPDSVAIRELATFVSHGGMQVRPRFRPGGREISVVAGRNRWEVWTLEGLRAERLRPDR